MQADAVCVVDVPPSPDVVGDIERILSRPVNLAFWQDLYNVSTYYTGKIETPNAIFIIEKLDGEVSGVAGSSLDDAASFSISAESSEEMQKIGGINATVFFASFNFLPTNFATKWAKLIFLF